MRSSSRLSTRKPGHPNTSIRRSPKLPASRQRRLDTLIVKTKTGSLTLAERRELKSLLDEVDRTTLLVLRELTTRQRK